MILIDTSVWADHFRRTDPGVIALLASEQAAVHPFVTGELIMGNPSDRKALRASLELLTQTIVCNQAMFYDFVEGHGLGGTGIGFVDAHLLASTFNMGGRLWTRDKRLLAQAARLGLSYSE